MRVGNIWQIQDFSIGNAIQTCRDSSGYTYSLNVQQLHVEDVLFANAIELTRWDEDPVKILITSFNGDCEPDFWGYHPALRNAGGCILFVPDWESLSEDNTYVAPVAVQHNPDKVT